MSFFDETEFSPPPEPIQRVHTPYVRLSNSHTNNEFMQLNDASISAKKAARRAFLESSNVYDAATAYLSYMNRILTQNIRQKTIDDHVKIALDGIDAIETNGDETLVQAKATMKKAVEHWMYTREYKSKKLYIKYNAKTDTAILL